MHQTLLSDMPFSIPQLNSTEWLLVLGCKMALDGICDIMLKYRIQRTARLCLNRTSTATQSGFGVSSHPIQVSKLTFSSLGGVFGKTFPSHVLMDNNLSSIFLVMLAPINWVKFERSKRFCLKNIPLCSQ